MRLIHCQGFQVCCPDFNKWEHMDREEEMLKEIKRLRKLNSELEQEIAIGDKNYENLSKVIKAIPECKFHGDMCIPNAIEWIEKNKILNKNKE